MGIVHQLLQFYDAPAAASFDLPPAEAIAYFKAKGLRITFDWRDMLGAEHASAFTVAKMADLDMLADIQASLEDAIAQGLSYRSWADTITPVLQAKGWWGRKAVTDPLTGETIVAQLGSPSRLQTIFRTNVQSAYAAGQWEQIQAQKDVAGFLLYDAVDDGRTREAHKAWDGTILPVDHDWWATHYPPNGWNCRCGVIQLSDDDLEEMGLKANAKAPAGGTFDWKNPRTGKMLKVEKGLDPGWNSNPGASHLATLQKLAAEKIKAMAPQQATAAAKGMTAAGLQAAELAEQSGIAVAPVIEGTAAQLAKGAGKAQLRQASAAINDALKANTPYLGKAIQKLQATKAGQAMDPVQLLAKAQADATKAKDAAALANWKQAKLAGKAGNANGQAVFDNLPEPAQTAILAEIDGKLAAAAQAKAVDDELAAIAAGKQGPLPASNLAAVKAEFPDASPAEILAKVQAMPAKLTAGQQAGGLAGWKKNAIAGKPPTAKQQLAFDSLTEAQQAKALQQVDDAKAALAAAPAVPPAASAVTKSEGLLALEAKKPNIAAYVKATAAGDVPPKSALNSYAYLPDADKALVDDYLAALKGAPELPAGPPPLTQAVPDLNPDQLRQIGGQRGSNRGGTYVDDATGTEWYVKIPASADAARNEVLAAKLYAEAGIDVPDLRLFTLNGETAIASRIEAGLTKGTGAELAKAGAFDGFAVDAWLANWDVAGATMDNLLLRGARAFRVDTGGALRYRAQGGLKGSAWGDTVPEIQSLRNAGTAPQAAKVFGKMTDADIEASVARVLAMTDNKIDRLIADFGPTDADTARELARTLKARRDDLARQFAKAAPVPDVLPDAPDLARVTAREQVDVEASRVNGFTFRTDSDTIEDQSVVVSQITSASGKPVTRLFLKVRGNGAKAIEARMTADVGVQAPAIDFADVRAKALAAVKSINSRADKALDDAGRTVLRTRQTELRNAIDAVARKLSRPETNGGMKPAEAAALSRRLSALQDEFDAHLREAIDGNGTLTRFRQVDLDAELPDVAVPAPKAATQADVLPWQRGKEVQYEQATFNKSNARLTSARTTLPGVSQHARLEGEGFRVTYIPDSAGNAVASRGVVMIDIDGGGVAATGKGFEILERIGVKATRSTQTDRLELYLDRIAYIRTLRNAKLEKAYAAAGEIADPVARAEAKLKLLNADVGRDMTKSRYWNPDGEAQAFGHGRVLLNRPDLDDAEVAEFAKDHVVYHNPSGLGVGASNVWDRIKPIIEGGGQFGSQVDRMRRGVASAGSSVSADHNSGGANYIFTRLLKRPKAGARKAGLYWNPERLMRRSDAFSYTSDQFGSVDHALQVRDRQIDPSGWRKAAGNGSNETNFRDSLSLFDDLEQIVFPTRAEYDRAIGELRAMGYRTWPDGRELDQVLSWKK